MEYQLGKDIQLIHQRLTRLESLLLDRKGRLYDDDDPHLGSGPGDRQPGVGGDDGLDPDISKGEQPVNIGDGANLLGGTWVNPGGHILVDRPGPPGPWEQFTLWSMGGNNVAIFSWKGYFTANDDDHDRKVVANRQKASGSESWVFEKNDNGTVSFSCYGHYLSAANGGGGRLELTKDHFKGEAEMFYLIRGRGWVALQIMRKGLFVSVQP